jgi:serine/threonine-protein kinase
MILTERLRSDPDNSGLNSLMGVAFAYLGRRGDAIDYGEKGVMLAETRRDAEYPYSRMSLLRIRLLFGDRTLALNEIPYLFEAPFYLTPEWTRVDPMFRPLRDDPRFQALLEKYDTQSN